MQERKRLTPEERKAMREKYSIHDKENETIYRHYGDLNGADFKLLKNKNCEIYILDWSKGMFIDECENCTIVSGPVDGSIFIRKCKNCKVSTIARQVRFRESENIDIFTYCPSDPVVETCFNIFFAPFNAFFPHLEELFLKAGFKPEDNNHIDTPYDFTPSEVLGGGLPHYSQLPESNFVIKIVRDGESHLEEMFKGYSEKEPFLINKADELPKLGESITNNSNTNHNVDDFGFGDNNNSNININSKAPEESIKVSEVNQQQNNIMNMDDFISMSNINENNVSNIPNNTNNNIDLDMFNFSSNNQSQMQYNNNSNININNNINNNNSFKTYEISKQNMTKEMEEDIRLQQIKEKTKEIREERIRQLIEKEAKLKSEIISKAMNYMNEFYEERKKRIELNHKKLLEKANNPIKENNTGNVWENLGSNMTGNSPADRMMEAILNKGKQEESK